MAVPAMAESHRSDPPTFGVANAIRCVSFCESIDKLLRHEWRHDLCPIVGNTIAAGSAVRAIAIIGILLVSCTAKSPDAKLAKSLDPAASWMAGLAMIGEKWTANSVPRAYVAKSLDAADDEFDKTVKSVRQSDATPPFQKAVLTQLEVAQASSALMRTALASNDRSGVMRNCRELAGAGRRLSAIAEDASQ
jgi:hypothetical protein